MVSTQTTLHIKVWVTYFYIHLPHQASHLCVLKTRWYPYIHTEFIVFSICVEYQSSTHLCIKHGYQFYSFIPHLLFNQSQDPSTQYLIHHIYFLFPISTATSCLYKVPNLFLDQHWHGCLWLIFLTVPSLSQLKWHCTLQSDNPSNCTPNQTTCWESPVVHRWKSPVFICRDIQGHGPPLYHPRSHFLL